MNSRYFVIFKCREKARIKTYEFKTHSNALNYFRLFYEPDSETLCYSINVSGFDAYQEVEHLLVLLTFIGKSINGDTVRKGWGNWNIGRVTIYGAHEFDEDSITQGITIEIYPDRVILAADDIYPWIDDDTRFVFR